MALIHRLLQHSREKRHSGWCGASSSKRDQNFESPEVLTSYKCWQAPTLKEDQIRLVVFKECDVKGKKILIDSKAIRKVDQHTAQEAASRRQTCRVGASKDARNGPKPNSAPNIVDGYQFSRPGSDTVMLGEMLFGSIPMSSNSPVIKVHTFKTPPRVMLSRVFLLKPPKEQLEIDCSDKDTISLNCAGMTIPRSISANSLPSVEIARSMPIAMPASPARGLDDESGEFSASGSFLSPFLPASPGSSVSSSASNGSLHRRWLRNQVTSMEHVVRRRSSENINNSTEEPIRPRKRYPKIGMAILFTLPEVPSGRADEEFRRFFFSHFSLLESYFLRLGATVERALIFHRKAFTRPIMEALDNLKQTVIDLYTSPRIQRPIWLNLMTYPQQRAHLCDHLVRELSRLLEVYNNKQNNFFMSRLLTGVLMHHLAWVPTVMPAGATPSRAFLDKHSSTALDMLARSHPYNPLWAQLGDVYGTIGLPNRIAKTVVVGKRADIVCKLLYVLSYFIRCSEVHETNEKCEDILMDYKPQFGAEEEKEEALDRRRTMTEESILAKTEDSGIEDVGLMQSESSTGKPVFYIQDMAKGEERLFPTETSSDDGVGFENESQDGAGGERKGAQCIHGPKGARTSVTVPQSKETRTFTGFHDSDDVFISETPVRSNSVVHRSKDDNKLCHCNGSEEMGEVVSQSIEKSAPKDGPGIVCKALDNTILVSRVEVATPVGRASKNIEDLLAFDAPDTKRNKAVNEPSDGSTLKLGSKQTPNILNSCGESSTVIANQNEQLGNPDLNHNSSPYSISDSIEIATKLPLQTERGSDSPSQRVASPSACTHPTTSVPSPPPRGECVQRLAALRLKTAEESSQREQRDASRSTKLDRYQRSVSSMSAASCASSTMSHMSDHTCLDHEELPLACSEPVFELEMDLDKAKSHVDSFGRSLLGGYCQHFVPDFALQGVSQLDFRLVEKNLTESVQHPVIDDSISEVVYVVADTDTWSVRSTSCNPGSGDRPVSTQELGISSLVDQLLDSVLQLHRLKLSSDFCLMHLEDRLQELYFQSTSVTSYLEHKPTIRPRALAGAVGVDCSDLPLLLAVASVHSPHVIANVMRETIEQQQRLAVQQDSP